MTIGITEEFKSAFIRVGKAELGSSHHPISQGDIKDIVSIMSRLVGYHRLSESKDEHLILISEDRLIPGLLKYRRKESPPIVRYTLRGPRVELTLFGPLSPEGISSYATASFQLPTKRIAAIMNPHNAGFYFVEECIAVGVHVYEGIYRSPVEELHTIPKYTAEHSFLSKNLLGGTERARSIAFLLSSLAPYILYQGHDCYWDCIDTNTALQQGGNVFLLPKGKPRSYFNGNDMPGGWAKSKSIYLSHQRNWLSKYINDNWRSVGTDLVAETSNLIEERLNNLNALPYMRINKISQKGHQELINKTGIEEYSTGVAIDADSCHWILAFHSFADEPFIWGADHFPSMYTTYLHAASQIRREFPADIIILRPHPNRLRYLASPEINKSSTAYFDILLQESLVKRCLDLGGNVFLSPLSPTQDILGLQNAIIITKHGNIALEAAWAGKAVIFSETAPYANIFQQDFRYLDPESLLSSIRLARTAVIRDSINSPSRENIARYQYLYSRQQASCGGIEEKLISNRQLPTFNDLHFKSESLSQHVARLRRALKDTEEIRIFNYIYDCPEEI